MSKIYQLTAFSISLSLRVSITFKTITGVVKKNKIITKNEFVNTILQYRLWDGSVKFSLEKIIITNYFKTKIDSV